MKKYFFSLFLIFSIINVFSQDADKILGKWKNEKEEHIIEIYKSNDIYYGRVIWLKDSNKGKGNERVDIKNPNTALENRKIIGIDYLLSFAYFTDRDVWKNGSIYNYETGNTYEGKISLNSKGELELTGYYGILWFLGRTKTYLKAN